MTSDYYYNGDHGPKRTISALASGWREQGVRAKVVKCGTTYRLYLHENDYLKKQKRR